MQVNNIDGGVEYVCNNKALSFVGEWASGEVHLGNKFVGYYEKDINSVEIVDEQNKVLATFANTDEGYEQYAATLLA